MIHAFSPRVFFAGVDAPGSFITLPATAMPREIDGLVDGLSEITPRAAP
jgi:hypothetical protein